MNTLNYNVRAIPNYLIKHNYQVYTGIELEQREIDSLALIENLYHYLDVEHDSLEAGWVGLVVGLLWDYNPNYDLYYGDIIRIWTDRKMTYIQLLNYTTP